VSHAPSQRRGDHTQRWLDRLAEGVVSLFFCCYLDGGMELAYPTVLGCAVFSGIFSYASWVMVEGCVGLDSIWGFWFAGLMAWNIRGFNRHRELLKPRGVAVSASSLDAGQD
jgi:hypothetical protein